MDDPNAAGPEGFEADLEDLDALLDENLDTLHLAAAEAYSRLADTAYRINEQAREIYQASEAYARNHPGGLLGGGFAIGLVVGLLFGRR